MPNPFALLPYRHQLACDALMADGAARGAVLGAIWGACFYKVAGNSPHSLPASMARNSLAFAVFLGAYGGVTCVVDKKTDAKATIFSSFAGGFTAGSAVSVLESTTRRAWLVNGAAAGMFTALFTYATLDQGFD